MVNHASNPKVKCFVICFIVVFIMLGLFLYKPPIKNATDAELDAIYGIKYDCVVYHRIIDYIELHPDCKVEDLRVVKGVGDMIIDQLERKWR